MATNTDKLNLERFDTLFDNVDSVYLAGEDLSGLVVLELTEASRINEVLLELKGGSKTYWTKHSGKSRKHFRDSDNYFCQQFNTNYTWQFGKVDERVLPKGKHEIPFSFTLPKSVPSSFEGDYGHIRYTCKVTLERPWDSDVLCKTAFTVIGIEDLNESEHADQPIAASDTSSVGHQLCCRLSGTISVDVNCAKSGFVCGEKFKSLNIRVRNDSAHCVRFTRLKLKQIVSYFAKDFSGDMKTKREVKEICELDNGASVKPNSTLQWDDNFFQLPPVAPSVGQCRIIHVEYELEARADNGPTVTAPIEVGAIPMMTCRRKTKLPGNHEIKTKTETIEEESLRHLLNNSKTFAVAFRDSSMGAVDISDEKENIQYGHMKFTPKYACYEFV